MATVPGLTANSDKKIKFRLLRIHTTCRCNTLKRTTRRATVPVGPNGAEEVEHWYSLVLPCTLRMVSAPRRTRRSHLARD